MEGDVKDIIIVDLDGTLALNDHRQHYLEGEKNWDAFFEACDKDDPNWPVIRTVRLLDEAGYKILIFSGRVERTRRKSEKWLAQYGVPFERLVMRPNENYNPDDALKEQWLNKVGKDRVFFVLDDRDKVVRMWRDQGLSCFQVAKGAF